MVKKNELQVVENFTVPQVLNQQDVLEEMDGMTFNFALVKIPSGGGLSFEVPSDDPESPDAEKEIDGVIVHHHPVNAYWAAAYTGGNEPPDCSAMDGKIGHGDPGGDCKVCPHNQWGSGQDGSGKACQNRRRVYVLREGEMFPLLLSLPPTSLQNFANYISRSLLQKGLRSYEVVSTAKLRKTKSGTGIEYSQALWGLSAKLDPQTAGQMRQYANDIKALASGVLVEDVEGSDSASEVEDVAGFKGTLVDNQ